MWEIVVCRAIKNPYQRGSPNPSYNRRTRNEGVDTLLGVLRDGSVDNPLVFDREVGGHNLI